MKKWMNKPYDNSITKDYLLPSIIALTSLVILFGRYFKVETFMVEDYSVFRTTVPTLMFFLNSSIVLIFVSMNCRYKYFFYHWLIGWLIILTSYLFVYPVINFIFSTPDLLQVPSITTFTCFWLFAIGMHYKPQLMGAMILIVSITAQAHYLFWYGEDIFILPSFITASGKTASTAMSTSTSIMFIALGVSLLLFKGKKL